MKALLMKDWMTTKGLIKSYLMILVIYAFVAYANNNVYLFTGLMIMIPLLMTVNSIAYDEHNHTVRLMLASGVSRKNMALSKYMYALILIGAMTGINIPIVGLIEGFAEAFVTSILLAIAGMAYISILLPLLFRFGTEKARIYMMLGVLIPLLAGGLISVLSTSFSIQLNDAVLVFGIVLLCLIVILVSMVLSIHIVEKKDY